MNLLPTNWADVPLASASLLGPLALFALVSSITPGPNNVMLASSGLNFGFRRSMPHLLGVNLGFTLMIFLVGIGLGSVFQQVPELYTVLKYAGAAYLLYLAWKIANSGGMEDGDARGKPFTFLQAAAFQWVNPKAWVMAITAMAVYTNPDHPFISVALISAAFAIVNLPSVSIWAGFGTALRGFLSDPTRLKWFNIAMGVLLAATLWPMLK